MERFLSSSIVAIPWAYEGHNHSPEAYAKELETLNVDERSEALKQAEEDSIIFATTVCLLAEFISSLPEGTNELMLCFSCSDRLVRDTLVLSIRALAAQSVGCTRLERRQVFPWLSTIGGGGDGTQGGEGGGGGEQDMGQNSEAFLEIKRRLRTIEEDNSNLRKERNELTMQLLGSRDEIITLKSHVNKSGGSGSGGGNNSHHSTSQQQGEEEHLPEGKVLAKSLSKGDVRGEGLSHFVS
jgi:hypothetical protein